MNETLLALVLATVLPLAAHAQTPPPPAPTASPSAAPVLTVPRPAPTPQAAQGSPLGGPDCKATTPLATTTVAPLACDQVPQQR